MKNETDEARDSCRTNVLFLIFRRPDTTSKVFDQIRQAKPRRLFVAADGPRVNRTDEAELCAETRRIIDEGVDWPCEVHKLYRDDNLGCRLAVSGAINWFFEQVEEGIILEDDTLPHLDFFSYCEEMLERYRDDKRVMHIGGFNAATNHMCGNYRAWFSHHAWIWGWATWRRSWQHYDSEMSTWDDRIEVLSATFASNWEKAFWFAAWRECREDPDKANTWGFPWMYTVRSMGALSVLPSSNLIENIGFGVDATHSKPAELLPEFPTVECLTSSPVFCESVDPYRDELITRCYSGKSLSFRSNVLSILRIILRIIRRV